MRKTILFFSFAVLTGCATSATPIGEAKPVPADELYAFQQKSAAGSGTLTVVRDSGALGSGCDVVVYIDGRRSAKVGPGQRASFYLQPGQPNIGIGLAESGLCSGMAVRSITGKVEADRTSLYRISGDAGGIYIGPFIDYR